MSVEGAVPVGAPPVTELAGSGVPLIDNRGSQRLDKFMADGKGQKYDTYEARVGASKCLELEPIRPDISASSLRDYQVCPRLFMYRHRYQLKRAGKKRVRPFTVGTLTHLMLASYYNHGDLANGIKEASLAVDRYADQLTEEFMAKGELPGGADLQTLTREMEQDFAVAQVMATLFVKDWPKHPTMRIIGVEKALRLQEKNIPQKIRGILDVLWEDTTTGDLWIEDHKTTSGNPLTELEKQKLSWQWRVYRLLATRFSDRPIKGVVCNILKKPDIEMCSYDRDFEIVKKVLSRGPRKGMEVEEKVYAEDGLPKFENYLRRCNDWYSGTGDYLDKADERKLRPPMIQAFIAMDWEPLLTKEFTHLLKEVATASRCTPRLELFPKNPASCGKYGDNLCEMHAFCEAHQDSWCHIRASQYDTIVDDRYDSLSGDAMTS